ncbi:MAG: polymorphic outer membrane protein [Chthoniobacteraceae bacterium]|nr:polymorphic outer membrane protein [Chthoniobacteraceae bacterium]
MTLTQCVLSGNSANSYGGAIYNFNASTLMQCTFSGNFSHGEGGAIYTAAGNVALTQCTLYGNSAGNAYSGGALYNGNSTMRLTHCTLSGNSSSTGGAIFNRAVLILANSIVAGNSAGTGPDLVHAGSSLTSVGVNFIGKNYTVTSEFPVGTPNVNGSYVGTNNSPLNARLAPLGNHGSPVQTMALLPGSLARDHASILSPAITRDQRGFPIIDAPDIGAYEAGTTNTFAIALCGKTAL